MSRIIKDKQLLRWSYDLHELVNKKLDEQILQTCAVRSKQLTFECLQKRHTLNPVTVDVKDLFDILFILALNFPEEPSDSEKRRAYMVFMRLLPTMLQLLIMYGDDIIRISQDPLLRFVKHYAKMADAEALKSILTSKDSLFYAVLIVWAGYYNYDLHDKALIKGVLKRMKDRYNVVRAGTCSHGSCK